MDFLTIYLIGALITFILARAQLQGPNTFMPSLLISCIWPVAWILKLMILFERK